MPTEFSLTPASPLKLEEELRALPFDQAGLVVYGDGASGAKIIYARELILDESQEVEQALSLHTADSPLVNYIELVSSIFGEYPRIRAGGVSPYFVLYGGNPGTLIHRATYHIFYGPTTVSPGVRIETVDDANINFLEIQPGVSGPIIFNATHSPDANVSFNFFPKGVGRLQVTNVNVPTISSTDTLSNKTLTAPVIADFTSAGHDHLDADDGGTLTIAALSDLNLDVALFMATPSSANLRLAVTDETGIGALVFANGPTLAAPLLGTPASGVLTNCTGLPTAGLVNAAVTLAKMANLAQDQFIGRVTASTGVPETATITAAARTVLDDTTVGAMLTTLGGQTALPMSDATAVVKGSTDATKLLRFEVDGFTAGATRVLTPPNSNGTIAALELTGQIFVGTQTFDYVDVGQDIGIGNSLILYAGVNIVLATATGTKIGTSTTQKLAFYNSTPIVKPSAYTQTYATATKTHTQGTMTDPAAYGAGANGYSTGAMASAIHAEVIALKANMVTVQGVVNSLIDDLQALGLVA